MRPPVKDPGNDNVRVPIGEIATRIGRSVRTVHALLKRGMPGHMDLDARRHRLTFDVFEVRAWLIEEGLLVIAEGEAQKAG